MQDIAFSKTSYRRFGSNTREQGREDFGFGWDAQAHGGTILFHKLLSQKNGRKNFRMSRPSLLKLSEELRPYIEEKSTSQRFAAC